MATDTNKTILYSCILKFNCMNFMMMEIKYLMAECVVGEK